MEVKREPRDENTPPSGRILTMPVKSISIGAPQPRKVASAVPLVLSTPVEPFKVPSFHSVFSQNVPKPKEVNQQQRDIPSISIQMPSTRAPNSSIFIPQLSTAAEPLLKVPKIQIVAGSSVVSAPKPTALIGPVPSITIRSLTDKVIPSSGAYSGSSSARPSTASSMSMIKLPSIKIYTGKNEPTAVTPTTSNSTGAASISIRSISIGSPADRDYMLKHKPKSTILPELMERDGFDYVKNAKVFTCNICFDDIGIADGIVLKNCLHELCKNCFIDQVNNSEDYEVICPNVGCEEFLQDREIQVLLPAEDFEKHLDKSLKSYAGATESAYHCKSPDCRGIIEKDLNVREFTCEVCKKVNCIKCEALHQGMNCKQYKMSIQHKTDNVESENAIKKLIETEQAMRCPKCDIPVMKEEGCDFITCTTCKMGICWRTKKPRNRITKENGTVIDGCNCNRAGGKPCHPQCRNCH